MTAAAAKAASDALALPPACEFGPSGWCEAGRHDRCAHRWGGPQHGGSWSPECYIINSHGLVPVPAPMVIEPSHVWRCPCPCHTNPHTTGRLW